MQTNIKATFAKTVLLVVCYLTMLSVVYLVYGLCSLVIDEGMSMEQARNDTDSGRRKYPRRTSRPSATPSTIQHSNKRITGNKQCLNIGLYYVRLCGCHCQFSIELTLSNMAFYCDPITTRPFPRFSCCYKRAVVRRSSIDLLLLYKHTVTYICSQLVYILEDIWQLMYTNRHRYELRLRKVIINLVIRVCAITDGNPSVGSYGHVIV